jgi:hypothetical protein
VANVDQVCNEIRARLEVVANNLLHIAQGRGKFVDANDCGAGADRRGVRPFCEGGGWRRLLIPATESRCSNDHVSWLELIAIGATRDGRV